ncbi:MAG TPA: UDP-N-acetylglucosamine 1-carboxyvinyltransferase [Peptococcaceae bacterium]|nr:UDP-N-acetylglucosamine 1-carboxyvinyltransferase [Peptococcaceae bacterium]
MEDKYLIEGGTTLNGSVCISGSKNASLPLLAASLLTADKCIFKGVPHLLDIDNMVKMLSGLGAQVNYQGCQMVIQARELRETGKLHLYARKMRASFLLLGPLLVRLGEVCLPLPGGCAIGSRPVDLHLKGLSALGARFQMENGYIRASARELRGCEVTLSYPSVGATENIMMAAAAARGKTTIINAALEPEIVDLANLLNKMGARVTGARNRIIEVEGNRELHGAAHTVIPDRIEAGTYMIAAAATGGQVHLQRVIPEHLRAVIDKLREAGVTIEEGNNELVIKPGRKMHPLKITTGPYPCFPTDLQPQFAVFLSVVPGESTITETVFENRFLYTKGLQQMGAQISVEGCTACIHGVESLIPAQVEANDLRAGAALVIAALIAPGRTEISGVYHLDRGYENLEGKLTSLGVKISRVIDQAANL